MRWTFSVLGYCSDWCLPKKIPEDDVHQVRVAKPWPSTLAGMMEFRWVSLHERVLSIPSTQSTVTDSLHIEDTTDTGSGLNLSQIVSSFKNSNAGIDVRSRWFSALLRSYFYIWKMLLGFRSIRRDWGNPQDLKRI